MISFYFYLISGIILITLEIITTTFYLLVIGISFILASFTALRFQNWTISTLSAGLLSILGCMLVRYYRKKSSPINQPVINHLGQEVEVVQILNNHLRVSYSGSYWNAVLKDKLITQVKIGDKLKIVKFKNNELELN